MPKNQQKINYRSLVTKWFEEKQKTNPRFSLGALAKKLGYSSTSSLSNVLSGKRSLSSRHAKILTEIMELTPAQKRTFLEAVAAEKMLKKGFDPELGARDNEVIDEGIQIPALSIAHFVAFAKTSSALCSEELKAAIEFITAEFNIDGKKIFDELLNSGVLIKDGDLIKTAIIIK
jgi:hypothetical protein